MYPWDWVPTFVPVEAVGRGGEEDVSVVAKQVGLKRRADGWSQKVNNGKDEKGVIRTLRCQTRP